MINDQSVLQGIPDNVTISDLSKYIVRTNRNYDLPIIVSAYEFAFQAHGDQKRSSGEPYIVHPLSVAWILVSLGMSPIKFLSDASTAMNSIIFMSAWQGAGYQMMIFLAGLQGIPRDQYEAASVDGATKFKQFLYITIPGLKGTIKYVIMITMIQAMKLFTQPYIMTQGGPKNSTKTLVYYIYTQGFQKGNFGYACSIAAVFFVIVVCMSMAMKKVTAATD